MNNNCLNILKWTEAQLKYTYDVSLQEATPQELHEALGQAVMMAISDDWSHSKKTRMPNRKAYYISAEYLIGRLVYSNLFNLGILDEMKELFAEHGVDLAILEDIEDDALGNGGLGRLAACFLDSAASTDIPLSGYGLRYKFGLFKQSFDADGSQVENADDWTKFGDPWSFRRYNHTVKVKFPDHTVLAVPYDVPVIGYGTENVGTLRLWQCEAEEELDFNAFNNQDYLRALDAKNKAEDITRVLYPNDSTWEGKRLRIKQQYVLSSASLQDMLRRFKQSGETDLTQLPDRYAVQLNDTHPVVAIPELIRLLLEEGTDFGAALDVARRMFAYTNHTIMVEALERWPQQLMEMLLPRVWEIITEIAHRYQKQVENFYHDPAKTAELAIVWDGQVRMANLCIAGGMAVNGVSALHSDILRHDVFRWQYQMEPEKFKNVTNGIDHRRWLAQINPRLDGLIADLCGGRGYLLHPEELKKLEAFAGDGAVLARLDEIKRANKLDFAAYVKKTQGVTLNTDAIFDVQVKRLHEYKRQLLNAMHIIYLYQKLQDDPSMELQPRTFLFGAKAAPGYAVAKRIIHLINSLANQINSDPLCRGRLQVVFLENYRVSLAEHLMPASEVSQQISTAGKEASGTGNMKFMMNGALTVGTLDGANVEMHEVLGDENMFLFGLHADEVARLKAQGYAPQRLCERDDALKRVVDQLRTGFSDGVSYDDLAQRLLQRDEYMLLQDFASYCAAEQRMAKTYADRAAWDRMSLLNIARSGIFAADRAVAQYADNIWHVPHK